MSTALLLLFVFFLGVILNAFFAGYETGFVSCNPIRVRHLAQKERDPGALHLLAFIERPDRMLTVLLLGTNIALMLGTVAITRLVANGFWATLIATPAFLIFGEILPKSVFRIHPTRLSLWFISLIRFFSALLAPLAVPVTWISMAFVKLLRGEGHQQLKVLMRTAEDMRVLVEESADRGTIEEEEKAMIHSVMDLQRQQAKEVMVPRIDVQALPDTSTRAELVALLEESGRTRIPIYHENIDQITGVANAFDVLRDPHPEDEAIQRFVKEALHVPDTMRLDDVLKLMRDERQPMAIVTDEFGGTDGLITLEDILEEIFGEIQDEYDQEESAIKMVAPNVYLVDARMPIEDASEAMGVAIVDEEVETVGGWTMRISGRIPQKGEVIEHGRFRLTVLDGGPNHLASLRLEVSPEIKENGKESTA